MNPLRTTAKILLVLGIFVFFGGIIWFTCLCRVREDKFVQTINLDDTAFHQATKMTRAEFVADYQRELTDIEKMHDGQIISAMAAVFCILSAAVIGVSSYLPGAPKNQAKISD